MRRFVLMLAALALGAFGLHGAAAQQVQQQGQADDGAKVTGVVTSADAQTGEITIDGKTFVMEGHGGATMFPHAGDKVTLFYRQQDDKNVITRIGQAQQ